MSCPALWLRLEDLCFGYDAPLFERLTLDLSAGWTGVVGANGAGKTTLLRLATGELSPQQGSRHGTVRTAIYCAQRTDDPPPRLDEMLDSVDPRACRLRGALDLAVDWPGRWQTLSHGERKRAQLAVALWQQPDLLAVDEPTNHVDRQARQLLHRALGQFHGVGLLVSHDRELLDGLSQSCLFVEPPTVTMRPGGYSAGAAEARRETRHLADQRRALDREHQALAREAGRRRDAAHRSRARTSKRKLHPKDSDGRAKIDRARLSNKDGRAGRLQRQLDRRVQRLQAARDALAPTKQRRAGIAFDAEPARCGRRGLLHLPAGTLALDGGNGRAGRLIHPTLQLAPDQRIGLEGPNGSGKSTLVETLIARWRLPPDRLLYLPQEVSCDDGRLLLSQVRRLPPEQTGRLMQLVSRLGSRPERLLQSDAPSPGELRKLLIALGLSRAPALIALDEPTNHLDLLSIECLEGALADFPAALLLVSHDRPLLERLTSERWQIAGEGGCPGVFSLRTG